MRELHPFLYFIEGWLTLWGQTRMHALANAARAFSMVIGQIDPHSGEVPPVASARCGDAIRRAGAASACRLVLEAAGQLTDEAA